MKLKRLQPGTASNNNKKNTREVMQSIKKCHETENELNELQSFSIEFNI